MRDTPEYNSGDSLPKTCQNSDLAFFLAAVSLTTGGTNTLKVAFSSILVATLAVLAALSARAFFCPSALRCSVTSLAAVSLAAASLVGVFLARGERGNLSTSRVRASLGCSTAVSSTTVFLAAAFLAGVFLVWVLPTALVISSWLKASAATSPSIIATGVAGVAGVEGAVTPAPRSGTNGTSVCGARRRTPSASSRIWYC